MQQLQIGAHGFDVFLEACIGQVLDVQRNRHIEIRLGKRFAEAGIHIAFAQRNVLTFDSLCLKLKNTVLYICLLYTSPSPRDRG